MPAFEFDPSIRVVFGRGRLSELPELVASFSASSVLIVTDPGLAATGIVDRAQAFLADARITSRLFSEVQANPTSGDIDAGLAVAGMGEPIDLIVAIGGGSALDCAKGINFLLTNGGRIEDYHGHGKAEKPMLPSIGVPTTAGTGSEAQSYALISQAETHVKMACGDRKARFRVVILDPDLVGSAPHSVKAAAGYDAMAHAVESYVCTKANEVSRMYAREGMRLLNGALERFVDGETGECEEEMLLGAHFAGTSIESSMLGAAHACANPLSAEYGTAHGVAVGVMLPVVVDYNMRNQAQRYAGLLGDPDLSARLREIRSRLGLPNSLGALNVGSDQIPGLAAAAAEQWTGTFNPEPVDETVCRDLYAAAL